MIFAILRRSLFVLFLAITGSQLSEAAELRFSKIGKSNGLDQGTVTALVKDNYGLLWIGTEDGLARFDGADILFYRNDPDDLSSLQDNVITGLNLDADKRLWISSESDGLSYFDYKSDEFTRIGSELLGNHIQRVFASANLSSVLVHSESGLFVVNEKDEVARILPRKAAENIVFVSRDSKSRIQVFYRSGRISTISLDGQHVRNEKLDAHSIVQGWSTPSCPALLLVERTDPGNGRGFVCRGTDGIKASPLAKSLSNIIDKHPVGFITDVVEQDDSTFWIATIDGLIHLSGTKPYISRHLSYDEYSLSSNKLTKLFLEDGVLFVGTEFDGLNILDVSPNRFDYHSLLNSDTHWKGNPSPDAKNKSCGKALAVDYDTVWSILEDSGGNLWVGNDFGLSVRRQGSDVFEDHSRLGSQENPLDLCAVWALEEIDGVLWLGIWGGLVSLDLSSGEYFHYTTAVEAGTPEKQSLSGKFVRLLLHDEERDLLWIGTNAGGLNSLNLTNNEIHHFPLSTDDPDQLPHSRIRSLYLDVDNQLWVGSGGGLSLWDEDKGTFRTLGASSESSYLSDEDVRSINQLDDDYFWIGTGNGLNLFNSRTFRVEMRLTTKDGLPNSTIYAMVERDQGGYWITTANGLSLFDSDKKTFKNFTVQNGLQSNEFNFNAWYKSEGGSIYVGGVNGLNTITPTTEIGAPDPHPPIITSVIASDAEGDELVVSRFPDNLSELSIPSSYRTLKIDYTIPTYINHESISSQHQLSRNPGPWPVANSSERQATYTNIDSGSQVFQVRSMNMNMEEATTTIYLQIQNRIRETVWFHFTFIAFSCAIAFALHSYYHRKRIGRSIESFRRQQYHIIEHELSPHLHQLKDKLGALRESPTISNSDTEYLNTLVMPLLKRSLHFLGNVRDRVNLDISVSRPRQIYMLEDILDEVRMYFGGVDRALRISQSGDLNVQTHQDAIYLLLLNLISNALKYSPDDTSVEVILKRDRNDLVIECRDEGTGIRTDKLKLIYEPYNRIPDLKNSPSGLGLGLTIVRHIVHTYRGKISVVSREPAGTAFIVKLRRIIIDDV